MKIVILTHTFPRFKDDTAAPFMAGLAQAQAELGDEVTVLLPHTAGFAYPAKNFTIKQYYYAPFSSWHTLGYSKTLQNDLKLKKTVYLLAPFLYLSGFLSLLWILLTKKPDVVHAHWILPNGFIAALACLFTRTPFVITLPGSDVLMAKQNYLFKLLARFAFTLASWITSNSEELNKDLQSLGADKRKMREIPYGVDIKIYRPSPKEAAVLRKKYHMEKDLVIVGVGRLVEKKGFRYLLQAVAKIKSIKCIIVGDGDERDLLEKQVEALKLKDRVLFAGTIGRQKLLAYYNLGDIFCLPSVRDSSGNLDDQSVSVAEAMACGKPIITTDFPGYRQMVTPGIEGYLVKEKDAKGIAQAISLIFKSDWRKMGEMSRLKAENLLSWEAIAYEYRQLYTQVVRSLEKNLDSLNNMEAITSTSKHVKF
jgi:glycosyltransferase involved in cell wall biosynthesis